MLRRLMPLAAAFILALSDGSLAAPELALLSRTLIQGPARAVAFSGDDVIIGTGCGIAIFRHGGTLRNPFYLPLEGEPVEIVVNGSLAYVAASDGGLVALDISGPGAPKQTFRHEAIRAQRCALAGSTLFVADAKSMLYLFDCADPREPRLKETKQLPAAALSLAADGDLLAITHPRATLIYRVGQGGAMREISEAALENDSETTGGAQPGSSAKKAVMRRGVLFILTSAGNVLCWDIANPERPSPIEPIGVKGVVDIAVGDGEGIVLTNQRYLLPLEIERPAGRGRGVRVKLGSGKGFTIESANRNARPSVTGSPAANETRGETSRATGVFMAGTRIAVVAPFDDVRLYELERVGAKLVGIFPTRGFAISLVAANGFLYVANGYDGVRIGRVGRDGTVDWVGHIQTVEARDVALSGAYLFIADGSGGLKAADVRDPARGKIVGRHASPYFMSALVVKKGRAYCAGGLGGVEIVDVAEPRRPKLVWRRDFSEVRGIDVDERHLYFADGYEGFRIHSLGTAAPVAVSVLDTPDWNCDCFVVGNTAYLADGAAGISVIDVSDRAKPRTEGSLSLGAIVRAVHALGETLFAAAHWRGVAAIDVSNPNMPSLAASYDTVDDARGIFADDDFVYAASGSGGVYVFRYSR